MQQSKLIKSRLQEENPRTVMPTQQGMSSVGIGKNILYSFAQFFLRFIIGLWFTRFLIHSLGLELYGLVPLAWSITQYFSLITLILNAPAGRYLIIDMSKGDYSAANKTFNTVFWSVGALSFLVLIVGVSIAWFSPFIFKIPAFHENDARIIFLAVSLSFVFNALGSSFSLSTYVTNKLYFGSLNDIIQLFTRAGIAVFFILFLKWQLEAVSLGIFVAGPIGFIIAIYFWRKLTPELTVDKKNLHMPLLKEMTGVGGWILIDQIGSLLLLNSELYVVNLLYDSESTGKYGALLIFPMTLRIVAQFISSSFSPVIMDKYAKKDFDGIKNIVISSSRLIGIVMALPIGLIFGFATPLINIWLGAGFDYLAPILMILIAHLCINVIVLPMFPLQVMRKKVKIPALVTCISGIIGIILAVALGQPSLQLELKGIALGAVIGFTLRNIIFTVPYGAHLLKQKLRYFLPPFYSSLFSFLYVALLCFIAKETANMNNTANLIIAVIFIVIVYGMISWFIFLSKDEKSWLVKRLPLLAGIK